MTLLVYVVVGLVLGGLGWSALQPVLAAPVFQRRNYREADVATASGLVIVLAVLAVVAVADALAAAGWSGDLAAETGRTAMLVAAVGFGFLGLLDDLAGTASGGGFRRHLAAWREGRLTTGAVKLAGGALLAMAVVAPVAPDSLGWFLVDAAVVALAANLANLLDRAPGRTIKVSVVAFAVLAAVDGATAVLAGPGVAVGSAAALAGPDLQERAMLGDTGANVLGAAVGLSAVLVLDHSAAVAILAVLALLNLASEWVSFSEVIDRTPPLRWLDRLGSRRSG
jgi:UDP-N-acetylmuramyl pentapeptide phosphotransferase/UDP-N-acetylglucosamine-1-phosphate transferase